MSQVRVAVLAGGFSLEREASLLSGHHVRNALVDAGHHAEILEPDEAMFQRLDEFEIAFVSVHGRLGEDGTIQSMLELAGIPYTGASALPSSLAWNKPVTKGILDKAGVPTPPSILLSNAAFRELGAGQLLERVGDHLGFPVVVKPASGGSALGVTRVDAAEKLPNALMHAMSYADFVLVERFVDGTELGVSFLDGRSLPPAQIEPRVDTYDYSARYTPGATQYHIPAKLSEDVLAEVDRVSAATWDALGARHLARVDLIVDGEGVPWVLELATCPGLTETSLWPRATEAAGIGFAEAVKQILDAGLRDA